MKRGSRKQHSNYQMRYKQLHVADSQSAGQNVGRQAKELGVAWSKKVHLCDAKSPRLVVLSVVHEPAVSTSPGNLLDM